MKTAISFKGDLMRKVMTIFSLIVLGFISIVAKAEDETPLIIVIDPGHGGIDGGCSFGEIKESRINLSIAKLLAERYQESGYEVILTRTDDSDVCESNVYHKKDDLIGRVNIINKSACVFYLSIHLNMFSSPKAKGFQVIYNKRNSHSLLLANNIYQAFNYYLEPSKRGVIVDSKLYVLSHTEKVGCLIECGFLSNPIDRENLCQTSYQKKLAEVIFLGTSQYLSYS